MTFLNDARAEQAQQRARTLRAIAGIRESAPASTSEPEPVPPFDGGARSTPRREVTHAETLAGLLRSREAHVPEFRPW